MVVGEKPTKTNMQIVQREKKRWRDMEVENPQQINQKPKTIDLYWFQLPDDMISTITRKLENVFEYFAFCSICKIPFPQPPWIMFVETQVEKSENTNENTGYYSLTSVCEDDKTYEFKLPEARGRLCLGSKGCWLILMGNRYGRFSLLNTITRVQIHLPTLDYTVLDDNEVSKFSLRNCLLKKIVLSSIPSLSSSSSNFADSGCTIMAIHHDSDLVFLRPGDKYWSKVPTRGCDLEDIIFYKGLFYAVSGNGELMCCEISDGTCSPKWLTSYLTEAYYGEILYLVELMGDLLLVNKSRSEMFEVFKLNSEYKWEEVKSLGEYSLFLGRNTSVSVLASGFYAPLKTNCIYFTHFNIKTGGHEVGVFDMEDNSMQRL